MVIAIMKWYWQQITFQCVGDFDNTNITKRNSKWPTELAMDKFILGLILLICSVFIAIKLWLHQLKLPLEWSNGLLVPSYAFLGKKFQYCQLFQNFSEIYSRCWLCACIPCCCCNEWQDVTHFCSNCNHVVGKYKNWKLIVLIKDSVANY